MRKRKGRVTPQLYILIQLVLTLLVLVLDGTPQIAALVSMYGYFALRFRWLARHYRDRL